MAAKAKDVPHFRLPPEQDQLPLLQFDYSFFGTEQQQDSTRPCLVGIHVQSGCAVALLALRKGLGDHMVVPTILQWLSLAGLV